MGEQILNIAENGSEIRATFIKHLLDDINALELMLEKGLIENDIVRIGSEQEFCLVNDNWRPSQNSGEMLKAINDPHFTIELAKYNLEINLDPVELKTDCFSQVEQQLKSLLAKATTIMEKHNTKVLLTGILPTISKNELRLDYMTPSPRFKALNDIVKMFRGTDFSLHIKGVDELSITHDSVLFEACNTSFQLHLQIPPEDFISSYNWAQAISGPILGISCNSPLLLGRELWSETRIALFQQSMDVRSSSYALKDQQGRVTFGDSWAYGSVAEIFKNDIARYSVLLVKEIETNSLTELEKGNIPQLPALKLHNGTIYRWNRPCFGVGNGKAHLRIENRYIPAGPTVIDEMANFAFWVGLMIGRPSEFDDMSNCMDFRDVKSNFIKAGRNGKESVLLWKNKYMSVRDLVAKELLPIAYSGLEKAGISKKDINRLLGIIEKRTAGMTGSKWQIQNYRHLRQTHKRDDALVELTKAMHENQQKDLPIHEWPMISDNLEKNKAAYLAGHIMSTQLFTINEKDHADLASKVMQWKNINHVPVENNSGELSGLLSRTHMNKHKKSEGNNSTNIVADIMIKDIITIEPETEITEVIRLMKMNDIECIPVVRGKQLVGIITDKDLIGFGNGEGI